MALPLLAGLGVSLLSNGIKAISGWNQLKDAREIAKNAVRPQYNIEDEYYDNVDIAGNLAQSGLTQESKDFYSTQADRGLSSSLDALMATGGGINSVSKAYDTYLQGNNRIASEDADRRIANIKNLMDQKSILAGQKTQQWAINEYEPYKDKMRAATQGAESGRQNIFNGISGVASGLANYSIATSQQGANYADGPNPTNPPQLADGFFATSTNPLGTSRLPDGIFGTTTNPTPNPIADAASPYLDQILENKDYYTESLNRLIRNRVA